MIQCLPLTSLIYSIFSFLLFWLVYFGSEPYYPTLPRDVVLLSRESLPRPLRLYNSKRSDGRRRVRFRVLAYPMSVKFQEAYAEVHQLRVGMSMNDKRQHAFRAILARVPKSYSRPGLVRTPVGVCCAIILATNATTKDLQRMNNLKMIHKVQLVMGISDPPLWYIPERESWGSFCVIFYHPFILYWLSSLRRQIIFVANMQFFFYRSW